MRTIKKILWNWVMWVVFAYSVTVALQTIYLFRWLVEALLRGMEFNRIFNVFQVVVGLDLK